MISISAFRVTQHNQIFSLSLEIEFNALRFINYTSPRLCSTYAVATVDNLTRIPYNLILCESVQYSRSYDDSKTVE